VAVAVVTSSGVGVLIGLGVKVLTCAVVIVGFGVFDGVATRVGVRTAIEPVAIDAVDVGTVV